METLMKKAQECMEIHMKTFETWKEGRVIECRKDPSNQNTIIVRYESGHWWHYTHDADGNLIWW